MGFKQNIPVLGILLFISAGFLAWAYLRPAPKDRLRGAALDWAQKRGPVADLQIFGTIAEIRSAPEATPVYAEFAYRDGEWVFVQDLYEEFVRHVKDRDVERGILERLGKKLVDRHNREVNIKENIKYEYGVSRDEHGIVGHFVLLFSITVGDRQRPGRYIEAFRHKDGRWTPEGAGRLLESPR